MVFYVGWALLSVIQAASTELFDDEAYYWVYSRFIDWGYFDHPPMIAALVKAGYAIFHNELGVRLFVLILNTATIFFVQQLTFKKDDRLFYAVAASIAVAQVGGIIAVPIFPCCFLWFFSSGFINAFFNIIMLATLFCWAYAWPVCYTVKYHGVLVMGLVFLSNLKLLTNKYTYVAALVCLVLFAPHLYWQYQHNFPSIQYHLFERNAARLQVQPILQNTWWGK